MVVLTASGLSNPALAPRLAGGGEGLACSASAPVLEPPRTIRPQPVKEDRAQRWVLPSVRKPAKNERMDEMRGDAHDEALARFVSHALTLSTPDALRLAVRSLVDVLPGAMHAHFLMLKAPAAEADGDGWLELTMSNGDDPAAPPRRPGLAVPVGEGLIGWAARSGRRSVKRGSLVSSQL